MTLPKTVRIASGVLALVTVTCGIFYLNRNEAGAAHQSTDDAYVQADVTTVAPQVSGTVVQVLIQDNQQVQTGQLLAILDDKDIVVALDAASAQVAGAKASVLSLEAQLSRQTTAIRQAQAAVSSDDASLKLARANQQRYRNLAADGAGTIQAEQQADAQLSIQQASFDKNNAGLQAARQQVDILQADLKKAQATLAQMEAAQSAVELKLSYTRITAPVSGTVGQQAMRVGDYVNVGKPLLAIVPLDAVYITANFRETQLTRMRPGQNVAIKVDALPEGTLLGKVDSLGAASGVSYSTVAPHNATGNFTKIVQRLPVRIRLDAGQPAAASLRVGMSVTPTVLVEK